MQYKDVYRYWAIFSFADDGITVEFPDLPGCITCGTTAEEAFQQAKDALALHLYGMEQDHEEVPEPPSLESLLHSVECNQTLVDVQALMLPFRSMMRNKAVKKTLTIPQWLNDIAEENKINFSQILQDALKQTLGIKQ